MKRVEFIYNPFVGSHNATTQEVEFEDDATEDEINKAWGDWLWEQTSEHSTWRYVKE